MHDECEHRCPELDACINTTVWCDGREDCPSGIDEALTNCSILFQLPPLYLFLMAISILLSCFIACLILWRMCRRRPRSILQTRLKSLSSDTAIIDEKGVICWHSDNSVRYVEVDRVTTVWRLEGYLHRFVLLQWNATELGSIIKRCSISWKMKFSNTNGKQCRYNDGI